MKPDLPLALIAVFGIALFLIERGIPLRRTTTRIVARLFVNLSLSACTFAVALLTVGPVTTRTLRLTSESSFGFLHVTGLPGYAQFILGFLLLDLGFYYWHIANHRIPFLWRFHVVHHLDRRLDTTTALRFHFGEVFFSAVLRGCVIAAFGIAIPTVLAFEALVLAVTLFHHSNIRVPDGLDRRLSLLIVTPSIHWVHHHAVRADTDSNYATVLSVWDRLFGSRSHQRRDDAEPIGVQARPPENVMDDEGFADLLAHPFRASRGEG